MTVHQKVDGSMLICLLWIDSVIRVKTLLFFSQLLKSLNSNPSTNLQNGAGTTSKLELNKNPFTQCIDFTGYFFTNKN
ncbi:hypothetical protein BpHYR1_007931 [Brachionus plicatilis]|uniref:Uncharacterized protein n=1 Tax=Brachionus plicatilis TaxID=10195 RepID=A0A3M7RI94_BRAPC|nr:hypothetical protein BpHYR1_007931 [Brachionus plicatilis]